jgi:four helix bundle protein
MTKEKIEQNLILKLTFDFALSIIAFCEKMDQKKKFVISMQLLKAGTAIGANAIEAQNSASKTDFIHKFKLAAKEADQTQYWLLLCQHTAAYPDCDDLLNRLQEINAVIGKIIYSSKKKNSSNLPADKRSSNQRINNGVPRKQHSLS